MAAARAGEMRAMRMQQQQPRRQVRTREFSDRQKDAVSQPSNRRHARSAPTSRIDLLTADLAGIVSIDQENRASAKVTLDNISQLSAA